MAVELRADLAENPVADLREADRLPIRSNRTQAGYGHDGHRGEGQRDHRINARDIRKKTEPVAFAVRKDAIENKLQRPWLNEPQPHLGEEREQGRGHQALILAGVRPEVFRDAPQARQAFAQVRWFRHFYSTLNLLDSQRSRELKSTNNMGMHRVRDRFTLLRRPAYIWGQRCRSVAQPGRALGLGPRRRRFKSCRSDQPFVNLLSLGGVNNLFPFGPRRSGLANVFHHLIYADWGAQFKGRVGGNDFANRERRLGLGRPDGNVVVSVPFPRIILPSRRGDDGRFRQSYIRRRRLCAILKQREGHHTSPSSRARACRIGRPAPSAQIRSRPVPGGRPR